MYFSIQLVLNTGFRTFQKQCFLADSFYTDFKQRTESASKQSKDGKEEGEKPPDAYKLQWQSQKQSWYFSQGKKKKAPKKKKKGRDYRSDPR